jgi:subtilisin family serine protease
VKRRKMKKKVAILMVMIMVISVTVVLAGSAADNDTKTKEPVIIGFKRIAAKLPEPAIENIRKSPRVTYVEMDGEVHTLDAELDKSWGVERIGAGTVHDSGNKGAGVRVAILDTGVDYTHSDLTANYKGGIGYKDGSVIDPLDDHGHGTHCAGIVAARDNEAGVIGVAPEADLYAVKVLNQYEDGYYGYFSDVIAGIEWSVTNMQVISMSFGGGYSESVKAACDAAYNAGIVVVASAGNSGNPPGKGDNVGYPAGYSSVIAVAATDKNDNRASFSSTGPAVELAAPGVSVYSTNLGGGYATMSGTSMAGPHVAGTAALVIFASGGDVRQCLKDTADDLGPTGFDTKYGYGLVDADEAALGDLIPVVYIENPADESTVSGTEVTIGVSASDDNGVVEVKYCIDNSGGYKPMDYNLATACWEATWDITGVEDGEHTITATATNIIGQTSTDSITVYVDNTPNPTMHIDSIVMSKETRGKNTKAIATVKIVDATGSVEGATVSGQWSGLTSDRDAGATDANGNVALKSDRVKATSGTFTFTVDTVTKDGWDYDPEANGVDPPSGSIPV